MRRQSLTRGQQRARKIRRRQLGTNWSTLAMIGSAVIAGLIASHVVTDQVLLEGRGFMLKLIIIVLAAIILWQNHGLLLTWGRAVAKLVKR